MASKRSIAPVFIALLFAFNALAQSIPPERPRARPPSELTGWADWEKAAEIFSKIKVPPAPPLSPDEAMKTFEVAPGFRLELVAAEPMVANPIFIEFDPDGRIWAVEYRGYMRDIDGNGEGDPICRVVVLEDLNEDGRADKSTVFLDGLVMPRTLAFVEGGVLVVEPPRLWYCQDTNGDLKCDSKTEVGRYGIAGNPQHTANGLAYGIDNWLHSADWDKRHRFRSGKLEEELVIQRGQFGVTFDELGRFATCRESSPLDLDVIPEHYVRRNPALRRAAQSGRDRALYGVGVEVGRRANICFPIRPTPAITLGANELREDGTLRTYTIIAGTGIYLGDQFPEDAYGNAFVPEAGGHLIGRLCLSTDLPPKASRYYPDGQELLASTDERFRPMSMRTGPDGALYFADMYHGIIEHIIFMAPYIANQIKERNLATGLDMGRIYRIVSTEKPINRKHPRLSAASSAELVEQLGVTNNWRRLTAQQLLVERRDPAALPLLRETVRSGRNHLSRMHALWTLDGLEALDPELVVHALRDPHEFVRATAIRLTKPSKDFAKLFPARDESQLVRLQTLLSVGGVGLSTAEELMHDLLLANENPLFITATLTGLANRETAFLERILRDERWKSASEHRRRFLVELAQTIYAGRNADAISSLLDTAYQQSDATAWRRAALLDGFLATAPADLSSVRPIALAKEPKLVGELLKDNDRKTRDRGYRLSELLTWPGHPQRDQTTVEDLGPVDRERFAKGATLYTQLCAPCHQPHGGGLANVGPPLDRSEWVRGPAERLVKIVLHGIFGPLEVTGQKWNHHMPAFGPALAEDESIAAVLTYIRRAWENSAPPVQADLVAKVRAETAGRELAWTTSELLDASTNAHEPQVLKADEHGAFVLHARKAVCHGVRLAYRPSLDIVAPWRNENDVALWRVHVQSTAGYEVFITLAADKASAGDQFVIETERSRVTGTVRATGSYDSFEEQRVGSLKLYAGTNRVLLRPAGKLKAELADVRALRLRPLR
jgi:mono/diheme cytochrome c family protein/glucose/arabinose dehydrogenase